MVGCKVHAARLWTGDDEVMAVVDEVALSGLELSGLELSGLELSELCMASVASDIAIDSE